MNPRGNKLFVAAICCFLKFSTASVTGLLLAEYQGPFVFTAEVHSAAPRVLLSGWGSSGSFQKRCWFVVCHMLWGAESRICRESSMLLILTTINTFLPHVVLWRELAQRHQDENNFPGKEQLTESALSVNLPHKHF